MVYWKYQMIIRYIDDNNIKNQVIELIKRDITKFEDTEE
jgi:hypothetical protein